MRPTVRLSFIFLTVHDQFLYLKVTIKNWLNVDMPGQCLEVKSQMIEVMPFWLWTLWTLWLWLSNSKFLRERRYVLKVPPFHAILHKAHSGNAAVPRVIPRSVLQVEELEGQIEQQKRQGTQYELASRMMSGWWVYSKIHRTFLETMVFNHQLWDSGPMLSGVVCCCSPIFPSSHGFPWVPVPCPGAVGKRPGSILRSSFGNWFAKIPIRREWGCKIMQNHYTTCSLDSIAR